MNEDNTHNMTDHNELLKVELQTVRRVETLESSVGEMRAELASLPGRILTELDKRVKAPIDTTWRWAFGIIITACTAAFLILHSQDQHLRTEILGSNTRTLGEITLIRSSIQKDNEREIADSREIARLIETQGILKEAVQITMEDLRDHEIHDSKDKGTILAKLEAMSKQQDKRLPEFVRSAETREASRAQLETIKAYIDRRIAENAK